MKKHKLYKTLSLLLASTVMFSSTPVNAADFVITTDTSGNSEEYIEYQSSDEEGFTNKTSVFAQIGSIYKVTIPKVIVLSGINKLAHYCVNVDGDIAAYETINVVPEEKVSLSSNNKDIQEGIIKQDKTSWTFSTLNTKANGTVEALGLTAGKWSGIFYFNIDMNKVLGDVIDPEHTHDENTITRTVIENEVAATCTQDGSYDEVAYCKDCGTELERISKTVKSTGHIPNPVVLENEANPVCTETGSYDEVVYCQKCGSELSRTKKLNVKILHTTPTMADLECHKCGEVFDIENPLENISDYDLEYETGNVGNIYGYSNPGSETNMIKIFTANKAGLLNSRFGGTFYYRVGATTYCAAYKCKLCLFDKNGNLKEVLAELEGEKCTLYNRQTNATYKTFHCYMEEGDYLAGYCWRTSGSWSNMDGCYGQAYSLVYMEKE